jgi:hypothetical protein
MNKILQMQTYANESTARDIWGQPQNLNSELQQLHYRFLELEQLYFPNKVIENKITVESDNQIDRLRRQRMRWFLYHEVFGLDQSRFQVFSRNQLIEMRGLKFSNFLSNTSSWYLFKDHCCVNCLKYYSVDNDQI